MIETLRRWFGRSEGVYTVTPYRPIRPRGDQAVRIQFVGASGRLAGETALPARERRREMTFQGVAYRAHQQHPSGVWVYRET